MSKQIYLFSTSKHLHVTNIKSLEVRFLKPQIDFSKYDYLIITSKQTVKALEQYEREEFINIPALCVSEKTAASYESFGGKILDIGDGYGDNLVKNIKEKSKDKKWLYLRAELIASDFVGRCQDDRYDIDEEILYVSECSKEILDIRVDLPGEGKQIIPTSSISFNSKITSILLPFSPISANFGACWMLFAKRALPAPPFPPLTITSFLPCASKSSCISLMFSGFNTKVPTGTFKTKSSALAPC